MYQKQTILICIIFSKFNKKKLLNKYAGNIKNYLFIKKLLDL